MSKETAKLAIPGLCNAIIELCDALQAELRKCQQRETDAENDIAANSYESDEKNVRLISDVAKAVLNDLKAAKIGTSTQFLMYYVQKQAKKDFKNFPEKEDLRNAILTKLLELTTSIVSCT